MKTTAWTALFLLPLIAGCATNPTVKATIPETLLADCPIPEWTGGTYRDLAVLAEKRRSALEECNDQMAAARDYQRRVTKQ